MPEIAPDTSTEQEPVASPEGTPPQPPQTVEEVEAIWTKRISGKDKAHAAEVAELRRQLELAKPTTPAVSETPEQARIRELEERLAQTERQRQHDIRAARFPKSAEYLGEALSVADEAKLAGLEALLADEQPAPAPRMDPNAAPRRVGPPPAAREPTKEELREQLRQISPRYAEYLKEKFG